MNKQKIIQKYIDILTECGYTVKDKIFTSEEILFSCPSKYKHLNFFYILNYLSTNCNFIKKYNKVNLYNILSDYHKYHKGKYVYMIVTEVKYQNNKQLALEL